MNKKIWASAFITVCILSLSSCFGGGGGEAKPSAISLTPPSASELVSYFKTFDMDILTQEKSSFANQIAVKLKNNEATSQSSVQITIKSRLEEGKLIVSAQTTGEAFELKSGAASYYDGEFAYYASDKTKAAMSKEDYAKNAYIVPFRIDKIAEASLSAITSQELNRVVTHYFELKAEAVDFSSLLNGAQFEMTENAEVSIEMNESKPSKLTITGKGKYKKDGAEYDAEISVSLAVKQYEDFALPEDLSEYNAK